MKKNNGNITEKIDSILSELNYKNNPYFQSLADGTFDKDDFIETQIQFYFAVTFFSRPMAALAAKIPLPHMRLEVVRNVWEEHGEGNLKKAHAHTFEELLKRLGNINLSDIDKRSLWPEIRIFNTTLSGVCVLDDYMTGVGTLGIIEQMFSDISSIIGKEIVKNKWLSEDQLIHYNLHEKLDEKHAWDFFSIVEKAYENQEHRYYIEQGMWMGATLFNALYAGLFEHRKRRVFRDVKTLHSRAEGIPC